MEDVHTGIAELFRNVVAFWPTGKGAATVCFHPGLYTTLPQSRHIINFVFGGPGLEYATSDSQAIPRGQAANIYIYIHIHVYIHVYIHTHRYIWCICVSLSLSIYIYVYICA